MRIKQTFRRIGKAIKRIVSSKEFVLAVVGLIFGSLIIPHLFSQIEDRQKELEIKTDLVKEMSSAIWNPIMMVQVLEQGRRGDTDIDLGNSTSEERILTDERVKGIQATRVIESQLRAYFPDTAAPQAREWNNLFAAAYNFVNLYLEDDEVEREGLIKEIYRFLDIDEDSSVIGHLKNKESANKHDYRESFLKLTEDIKDKYDQLTSKILDNDIREYRAELFPLPFIR